MKIKVECHEYRDAGSISGFAQWLSVPHLAIFMAAIVTLLGVSVSVSATIAAAAAMTESWPSSSESTSDELSFTEESPPGPVNPSIASASLCFCRVLNASE